MKAAHRTGLAVALGVTAAVAVACFLGVRELFRTSESLWPARAEGVRIAPSRPVLLEKDVRPDNAFFFLRQLTNLPWHASDRDAWQQELERFEALGGGGAPYPLLDTFLASNSASFALWDTAGVVTGSQCVTIRDFADQPLRVGEIMLLAKATPYRAERAVARGEWSEAVRIWEGGLRACDHLSRGGTLLHTLVQVAGVQTISRHVRRSLLASNAPPETIRLMRDFLLRLDAGAEPPGEIWRGECLGAVATATAIYRQPERLLQAGGEPYTERTAREVRASLAFYRLMGSTPERTRTHLEAVYSRIIRIAESPFETDAFERDLGGFMRRDARLYLLNDPLGRMMIMAMPARDAAKAKLLGAAAHRRGTALALAVALHQRESGGRPPESLGHMVPAQIPALCADPYSKDGAPFRYRREESGAWRLYSIGPNQKDDGGDPKPVTLGREYATFNAASDLLFDPVLFDSDKAAFEKSSSEMSVPKNGTSTDRSVPKTVSVPTPTPADVR